MVVINNRFIGISLESHQLSTGTEETTDCGAQAESTCFDDVNRE